MLQNLCANSLQHLRQLPLHILLLQAEQRQSETVLLEIHACRQAGDSWKSLKNPESGYIHRDVMYC